MRIELGIGQPHELPAHRPCLRNQHTSGGGKRGQDAHFQRPRAAGGREGTLQISHQPRLTKPGPYVERHHTGLHGRRTAGDQDIRQGQPEGHQYRLQHQESCAHRPLQCPARHVPEKSGRSWQEVPRNRY